MYVHQYQSKSQCICIYMYMYNVQCTVHTYVHSCSVLPEGQWSSLTPSKRREKEAFLASEKRASRGFISQANQQMELLDIFSEMEEVAKCLCQPPLARRTAAAVRRGVGGGGDGRGRREEGRRRGEGKREREREKKTVTICA